LPIAIALIKGTNEERRQIVAGQVGGIAADAAAVRLGASVGMKAPGWVKLPAALTGAFIAQCAVGGECDPVKAAKATGQVAVETVKKAYSSPRGYLETFWDFSLIGMNVNFIKSIFD
jgi:hypothetical protein